MRPQLRKASLPLVVALLVVAGCSDEPEAQPAPDTAAYPVVVTGQAQTILAEVDTALRAGVPTGDKAQLGARAVGPFLAVTLADATAAKKTKAKIVAPSPVQNARLMVPVTSGWPRFFVAAGTATGQSTPVMRVLTSGGARQPYGLWASLSVLPGASVPQVADATTGAAELADDAGGYVLTPQQVADQYGDVLLRGDRSKYAASFAADEFSRQVLASLKADQTGVAKNATVGSTHKLQDVMGLKTKDGGALVMAWYQHTYTVEAETSRELKINDRTLAALAGKDTFKKEITRTSAEVVAFVVPAGGGKVQVIAGDKGTTGAKAT